MVLHSLVLGGLLLGVDVGWQPLPDGDGMEYLIQLSPQDIEAMKTGEPWMTDIPSSVENVRAYRITIGNERLERIDPPPALPPEEELPRAIHPAPGTLEPGREPQLLPERQAVHMTPKPGDDEPAADSEAVPDADQPNKANEPPPRPWMLLVGTALALAGSLGGNAYLLWVLREAHRRYRSLAETRLETPAAV